MNRMRIESLSVRRSELMNLSGNCRFNASECFFFYRSKCFHANIWNSNTESIARTGCRRIRRWQARQSRTYAGKRRQNHHRTNHWKSWTQKIKNCERNQSTSTSVVALPRYSCSIDFIWPCRVGRVLYKRYFPIFVSKLIRLSVRLPLCEFFDFCTFVRHVRV